MKLLTFTHGGRTRIGRLDGDVVIDLSRACPDLPRNMRRFLAAGESALAQARDARPVAYFSLPLDAVRVEAPVPNPSKYLAIGMNYRDHVEETAQEGLVPSLVQTWFNKQVSCVNGPFDPVLMPQMSEMLDYEVELCVVIGRRCRNVPAEQAAEVIAGYMVANDFSVRDVQLSSPTWTLGKSFDSHGPVGPWLVTPDEVGNPHDLEMQLSVNGEVRQRCGTGLMIHNIFDQIAFLSRIMTLEPGDLLATGTPRGVGMAMSPPSYLKPGDVVRAGISRLGNIENRVVAST